MFEQKAKQKKKVAKGYSALRIFNRILAKIKPLKYEQIVTKKKCPLVRHFLKQGETTRVHL